MDRYCINRGTLLDNAQVKTLLNPEKHSLHCLVDVGVCRDSGYEILAPLSKATADAAYCPAYRIGGDSGFDKTLKLARELGSKDAGCTTCTGSELKQGFRAVFVGTVSSGATWSADKPPELEVTQVLKAGSQCPDGLSLTRSPCEDPPATSFCSRFDATCGDGDNKWESCATDFPKLAAGSGNGPANTQACRAYHLGLAEASADSAKVHCPHASKAGMGVCVDVAETTGMLRSCESVCRLIVQIA